MLTATISTTSAGEIRLTTRFFTWFLSVRKARALIALLEEGIRTVEGKQP